VVKIKELMGHASIVTTMRYIHATDQGKRGAITVMGLAICFSASKKVGRLQNKRAGPPSRRCIDNPKVNQGRGKIRWHCKACNFAFVEAFFRHASAGGWL